MDTPEFQIYSRTRRQLRRTLRSVTPEAEALLAIDPAAVVHPEVVIEQVNASLHQIEPVLTTFKQISHNILVLPTATQEDEAALIQDADEHDDYALSITTLVSKLRARKARLQASLNLQARAPGGQDSGPVLDDLDHTPTPVVRGTTRLPKLNLQTFDGDIFQWREFWDMYQVTVHTNEQLSNVQKFSYLRASLKGAAAKTIAGLQQTTENYTTAVTWLQERFGSPQTIIDAHYAALTELKAAYKSIESLRYTYDEMEKHLRSLEALGEDTTHRHFISMIKTKLPKEVLTRLEEQREEQEWTVKNLRKQIHKYIVARELAERQGSQREDQKTRQTYSMPNPFQKTYGAKSSFRQTTEALLSATSDSFNQKKLSSCLYCGGNNHYHDECKKVVSAIDRENCLVGRCLICLKTNHNTARCKIQKVCYHCGLKGKHHRSLCPTKFPPHVLKKQTAVVASETLPKTDVHIVDTPTEENVLLNIGERVLLQTAKAVVQSPVSEQEIPVRLLLDTASHRSYITSALVEQLKLPTTRKETLSVLTFGSEKVKALSSPITNVQLKLLDGSKLDLTVNVVQKITGDIQRAPITLKNKYLIQGLPLADSIPYQEESFPIDVLIGADYYLYIVTAEKMELGHGLFLLGSHLGWLLTGTHRAEPGYKKEQASTTALTVVYGGPTDLISSVGWTPLDSLQERAHEPKLQDFWDLEVIGIQTPQTKQATDEAVLQTFQETITFENGRYHVAWPWKDESMLLPDNYKLALGRLRSLLRHIGSNKELLDKYNAIIQDQLTKNIIEPVDTFQLTSKQHYIPHHAIIIPQRVTTKVRIVYDASAKTSKKNNSLKDCLYRGPVILGDICGMLLRFRLERIALISDIEKAFLQIGLQRHERDVTRFVWLRDPSRPEMENNLQIFRFTRVPFGIVSSPFLLAATVNYHLGKNGSAVCDKLRHNMYVDNVITGVSSLFAAKAFYNEAKSVFSAASMNLREWASNDKEFCNYIPETDRIKDSEVKVLGIKWDTVSDTLTLQGQDKIKTEDRPFTKRTILKQIASVFDPLGFYCPVTIRAKIFLQDLWLKQYGWDQLLPVQLENDWIRLMGDITDVIQIKIPRFLFQSTTDQQYQLHCFCDSSEKSYSTVAYLKLLNPKGNSIHFLFAKSRLAPVRKLSMPRLELLALVVGARILTFLEKQLRIPISARHLWSDSKCALQWVQGGQEKLPIFVKNRVIEIRQHPGLILRFVPGTENPADLGTRGLTASQFASSQMWWRGPAWMNDTEDKWIQWSFTIEDNDTSFDTAAEIPDKCIPFHQASLSAAEHVLPLQIDPNRYSSLGKLIRITAYCLRFVSQLKRRTSLSSSDPTSEEITQATLLWEKSAQQIYWNYPETRKKKQLFNQLGLKVDTDGLLRCHGRLSNSPFPFPKLLQPRHPFTDLIIQDTHRRLFHSGVPHTLSSIRNQYWIPKGRVEVGRVLRRCVLCRHFDGGPFQMPPMAPIPTERLSESSPFTFTGVDYFGPLFVKTDSGSDKVWGCLFTCLVVRAIHLEVVTDMSTNTFLLALRRFIARRGKPTKIISDNSKYFRLADKVLCQAVAETTANKQIKKFLGDQRIEWSYIKEFSPWMGGVYERMIGLTKRLLRKTIQRNCLTMDELTTVFSEVENVVNSRPLVYVSESFDDLNVLTPSKFLSLNPCRGITGPCSAGVESFKGPKQGDIILANWKRGQELLQVFWHKWRAGYLASLREQQRHQLKQPRIQAKVQPRLGAIVTIKDALPRGCWRMGRITELINSRDNEVRAVKVRLANKKVITRPINLLYPLEVDTVPSYATSTEPLSQANKHEASATSSRQAAIKAKEAIKLLARSGRI